MTRTYASIAAPAFALFLVPVAVLPAAAQFETRSTLAAGASCTVTVTFAPKKTSIRNADVYFEDTGGASPQIVPISGTGD